jgi:hypothetical protein
MYSRDTRERVFLGLTSDDANLVRYGMSGADRIAGNQDDYTISLVLAEDCSSAHVRVLFEPPQTVGATAECAANIEQSFEQTYVQRFHWTLTPTVGAELLIRVNPDIDWDYSVLLFHSGFETGDLGDWGP